MAQLAARKEKIMEKLLDFFFPKLCLSCKKEKTYLCPECFFKISIFKAPYCPYCKLRSYNGTICKNHKSHLSGFIASGSYADNLLRKTINSYKYNFVKELSTPLSAICFKFLKKNPEIEFFKNPLNFLILPIPLHKKRLRWRGFNQATEIGKKLSLLLKIPIKENILIRKKPTKAQAKIKKIKDKKENIKNAFLVKNANLIENKKIILVDDVATSLYTMEEAARSLKKNKIKEIWGIAVAKG